MSSDADRKMPDDEELEDFLAGRHPLGKAYREASGNETAPARLDAAILDAARAAVRAPRLRRPRWVQPVAVAATLALSLGVLMNLWRDPVTREQIAPTAESGVERLKARAEEDAPTPGSFGQEGASPAAAAAPGAPRESTPEAKLGASAESVESAIERRSVQERGESRPIEGPGKPGAAARNSLPAPAAFEPPEPAPARRPMVESMADSADDLSGGSTSGFTEDPPPLIEAPPPPSPKKVMPQRESRSAAPGAGGLSGYRHDLEPAPPTDEKQARDTVEQSSNQRAREQDQDAKASAQSMAPPSAPATTTAPSAAPAPATEALRRELGESADDNVDNATPEEWIREIRAARDRGEEDAAQELIKRFRAEYPAYVLPADVRALEPR